METPSRFAGIRFFHWLLRAATVLLAAATVIAVPLLSILAFTSHIEDVTIPAEVQPPYSVEFADGSYIDVAADGEVVTRGDFPVLGEESRYLGDEPHVEVDAKIDGEDRDTRIVIASAVAAFLALVWFGLVNLKRVVATARSGEPFDVRNPRRLQYLAAAVLALALLARVAKAVVDATLDSTVPVEVAWNTPNWFGVLATALALLALAEVFRRGTALRELEATTI